jgi:hypothetical protein
MRISLGLTQKELSKLRERQQDRDAVLAKVKRRTGLDHNQIINLLDEECPEWRGYDNPKIDAWRSKNGWNF